MTGRVPLDDELNRPVAHIALPIKQQNVTHISHPFLYLYYIT